MMEDLASEIERLHADGPGVDKASARDAFERLRELLSTGEARAAEPDASALSGWRVNGWVKRGILLGFRCGEVTDMSADHGRWPFYDKDTLPLKRPGIESGVRIVPGGSSVRDGVFLGRGVVCMPPMFINVGAYVGEFGSHGAGNGQLNRPEAIDADTEGNVWVAERGNNRVQAFDQAGKYEGRFGAAGSGQDQFNIAYPMGLAADSEGHLWVADTANNRIQEWTGYRYTPSTESAPSGDDPSVKIQSQGGQGERG